LRTRPDTLTVSLIVSGLHDELQPVRERRHHRMHVDAGTGGSFANCAAAQSGNGTVPLLFDANDSCPP
jgi:hypothetical protein